MANCTITDRCSYRTAAGGNTAIVGATVYAVPDMNSRRLPDVGGTYRTLGVNPDVTSAALKRAVTAVTDSNGEFTFVLPYSATSIHPATPAAQWTIMLPSGDQWVGQVPSVAGPLTIDDLVQTYSWTATSSVYVAPVTPGTLVRGTKVFTASSSEPVAFSVAFASSAYTIRLSPSIDSVTSNIPAVAWSDKSTTGFTIQVTGSFTGSVDFEAVL